MKGLFSLAVFGGEMEGGSHREAECGPQSAEVSRIVQKLRAQRMQEWESGGLLSTGAGPNCV